MIVDMQRAQWRRSRHAEQGFTLIELLIVIIVLGILAAIVVFALGSVTSQSAVAACNSDAKTVSIAVSASVAEQPSVMPTMTNLVSNSYLKSQPNSSYYTISLTTVVAPAVPQVQVALTTLAPGATWLTGSGTAAAIGTTAENYEGASIFTWSNAGTGANVPAADVGQNVCAGA